PPPPSLRSPYTTLFRSDVSQPTVSHHLKELATAHVVEKEKRGQFCFYHVNNEVLSAYVSELQRRLGLNADAGVRRRMRRGLHCRSEEHTSELQSRENLV